MQGSHGMAHGKHMRGKWGMDMFAYVPMAILFQKDLLGLSNEQVQKVQSIKQEMQKARGGKHEAFTKVHEQMTSFLKEGKINLPAYESAMKQAANEIIQARVETARRAQDALQVLNTDQRTRFLYSMEVMHQWMEMHGMKHHEGEMTKEGTNENTENSEQAE
ncbi:MAG TPA: hypothetical protein VFL97_05630 [Nitrococcus sp.]|nr:hypothetical protein [Nitrococcus sp.]